MKICRFCIQWSRDSGGIQPNSVLGTSPSSILKIYLSKDPPLSTATTTINLWMVSYSFFYPASHSIHTETYQFYCCCYCFSDACYRVTHQSCKLHICGSTSRSGKIERERLPNRSHWQCFERGKYPFHQINC